MNQMMKITTLTAALLLAACATRPAPLPGDAADVVQAKLGTPTAVYTDGATRTLEYATGPMGQYTWMAHLGQDGRLTSYEQVLTGEKFATLKVDQATKDQVLRTIGRPAEQSRVAMQNYEVWSYRYKEAGVWNSMMHVHFDGQGIVRQMMNGPDPMYEPRERSPF
ncbi:outer membrane protein assembly factor BamE [Massilia aurea]|uniref:outer membrane protein assembly factor BamE domain-containing protein n=1 Tax=Massilia aurea TaxID=373040 RepID=UPI003462AFFB